MYIYVDLYIFLCLSAEITKNTSSECMLKKKKKYNT